MDQIQAENATYPQPRRHLASVGRDDEVILAGRGDLFVWSTVVNTNCIVEGADPLCLPSTPLSSADTHVHTVAPEFPNAH